jgi:phospholipid/cholesterol/gamma-HCH transport system ATP-binding protein
MQTFIEYRDVYKTFGSKRVLQGVSLAVERGETVVILGGSGTGKSVLLKHTIGLMKPDAGHILVDGEDITDYDEEQLNPVRKKVGMLFQGGALFDSMSVFENVAYALREHTALEEEEIARRVREKLALVEMSGAEEIMPADLSGGMKKRVALARSIALEPAGLLYDEPTTGLDPLIGSTINQMIRNLQRALSVTSVVVTHDIHSAFTVADRIAFLSDGVLCFVGSVEEAQHTSDERLRRFLGGGGFRVA